LLLEQSQMTRPWDSARSEAAVPPAKA